MSSSSTCIVFDLDDTLYLERDYVWSGFQAVNAMVSKRAGLHNFALAAWRRFERGDRGNTFDMALQDVGQGSDPALVSDLVSAYRTHLPIINLAADVLPALAELHARAEFALITDGFSCCQRNKIEALGIANWFNLMIVTDEIGSEYRKPHPRAFQLIEQAFTHAPTRFVYVGDNPAKDFISPRLMGWTTIRIRREGGLHSATEYPDKDAHFEIKEFSSLKRILFPSASVIGSKPQ